MTSEPSIKFICLKWGTKYGPEYVNRLYGSIRRFYRKPHSFLCFTDDTRGLRSEIEVKDIEILRKVKNDCFTMEKLFLFDVLDHGGPYCLFDIDILIQSDITRYFDEYKFEEPRFAISARVHGVDIPYVKVAPIYKHNGLCYVNSSFVTWMGDQLKWMPEFYLKNKQIIDYKYKDLDTFLFHCVLNKMHFHPTDMIYSFNHEKGWKDVPIVMFNTSHGRGVELHEAPTWARNLWTSFDSESGSVDLPAELRAEQRLS